jgi:predicted TIM-barrel enzyme
MATFRCARLALPSLCVVLGACATTTPTKEAAPAVEASAAEPAAEEAVVAVTTEEAARKKLAGISGRKVQLWVVVHIRAHKHMLEDGSVDEKKLIAGALKDADAVVNGGGDMIILINSRCEMPLYERVITAVRERHKDFPLGISALSYGPENLTEGFRLAKAFDAKMVWTEVVPDTLFEYEDDDGSYVKAEVTPRALARDVMAETKPDAMLVAGVHMKYTRNLDGRDFEEAMTFSLGAVDGLNITGPRTGVLADAERVAKARAAAGGWPVGLASGVSTENIGAVIEHIDYAIVGTSLKEPDDALRTSESRVRELRELMTKLSEGESAD